MLSRLKIMGSAHQKTPHIAFRSPSELQSWKKTFPDVANSPGYHACTLFVGCVQLVTASDGEEGGWVRAFSGIQRLGLDGGDRHNGGLRASEVSLSPFRGISPTLKSLRLGPILLPYPGLLDLLLSFPLLENLSLRSYEDHDRLPDSPQTVITSASPPLTGSLAFCLDREAGDVARELLDLPNGLHLQNLALWRHRDTDFWWIAAFVKRCSHTLESLDVVCTSRTFIHIYIRTNNLTSF